MISDIEMVVGAYLRGHDDVLDITDRVMTRTPPTTDEAWVRLTLLTDEQRSTSLYFVASVLQVECYAGNAGGQSEASVLARTVRDALDDMPQAQLEDAVVTSVVSSMRRMPDDVFEPARERYIIQSTITHHAWVASS